MASSSNLPGIKQEDIESFQKYLQQSKRVLAVLGAGVSASSGLPTFRGAGGLWRTHNSISLATPGAFEENPGLVWQFYNYRRHMSLQAQPNGAHYALAELARRMPGFMTLSQNVDGLSVRANHPPEQLQLLHGTLFELRCASRACNYREANFVDPVVPALAPPTNGPADPTTNEARAAAAAAAAAEPDISDASVPLPKVKTADLPQCPACEDHLLRPGVVWFGENLPSNVIEQVDAFFNAQDENGKLAHLDLVLVIGTSSTVYPAAGYAEMARQLGARVAVINMDVEDAPGGGWQEEDWKFQGDAAVIVPELLKPIVGDVKDIMAKENAGKQSKA